MDDATIAALLTALSATPENTGLRGVLIRACLDRGEVERGLELLGGLGPADLDTAEDRLGAARLCEAAGDLDKALAWCVDGEGELAGFAEQLRDRLGVKDVVKDTAPGKLRLLQGGGDRADEGDPSAVDRAERPRVSFADVGGLDALKKRIRRKVILPMQKPSLLERFKKRTGGGVLLYGPPGCGKTLIARATAGEIDSAFFNVAISDVLDMYVGESEQRLHAIFEKARAASPSVLFFDEVEALGGKRSYARDGTTAKLVSQFLAELDGFDSANAGVLVLGATNVPWAVDPAFRRPGRFDRVLFVPPPDRPARERILEIHLKGRPVADDVKVALLAKKTSGFSGADLEHLVETAADEAIDASLVAGRDVPIAQEHLIIALEDVKPTTAEWLTQARNYARYANESGQYDEVLEFLAKNAKR